MSAIKQLTPDKEKLLSVYRDKWLAKGLSTDRINRDEAVKNFILFNRLVLSNKSIPTIIFMDSPVTAWLATCLLFGWTKENKNIESQVWSQVESQVWSQVGSFIYPYLDGNFGASHFSFYDYCNKVLKIKLSKQTEWDCYLKTADVSLVYPFKDFVIISEKPTKIRMENMRLHSDGSPSVEYCDGFKVWSLWGVRVPRWLAEIRADKLDAGKVMKLTNVEQRMAGLKKFGVERLKKHGNLISKSDDYELIDMSKLLPSNRYAPYLFMRNPSVGVIHAEGVDPSCKSVSDALHWRNKTTEQPIILT